MKTNNNDTVTSNINNCTKPKLKSIAQFIDTSYQTAFPIITSFHKQKSSSITPSLSISLAPQPPKANFSHTIVASSAAEDADSVILTSSSDYSLSQSCDEDDNTQAKIDDVTLLNCNEFFPPDKHPPEIISRALKIKNCTIIKYGIKPSLEEVEYSYCGTCDVNLINPICLPCIKECHIGHDYRKEYMKGNIKCYCGEKMHRITKEVNSENVKEVRCLLNEWAIISNMRSYYMIKRKVMCIFCKTFCTNDKDKDQDMQLITTTSIPNCDCQNEHIHTDTKAYYDKLIIIHNTPLASLLQSTHLINLIFQSIVSFKATFNNFIIGFNRLTATPILSLLALPLPLITLPTNFTQTNTYQSLCTFYSIISLNKHTSLRYYSSQLENYFSFENIRKIMDNQPYTDAISYYSLGNKLFLLFNKIYIGNHTSVMDKYKLTDLENITPTLRLALFHWNKFHFPQAKEITSYCICILNKINTKGFKAIEAYDYFTAIIHTIKRLSIFNLITNRNMLEITVEIEKLLHCFAMHRKHYRSSDIIWDKEAPLFLIILKMLHYSIYSYNDRIIRNALMNKHKESIDSLSIDTATFIYNKTDLGRMISRITIRIMGVLTKCYSLKNKTSFYKKITGHGMKILSFLLHNEDSYLLSLNNLAVKTEYYIDMIRLSVDNCNEYRVILEEQRIVEEGYRMYYSFEENLKELIERISTSLDRVSFIRKEIRNVCVVKANYFSAVMKVIRVVYDSKGNDYKEDIEKITKKMIYFYKEFIDNSADNSLLLLSHYMITTLALLPSNYSIEVFSLIYYSVEYIAQSNSNNTESIMSYSKHIIKISYKYLQKTSESNTDTITTCLSLFLNTMYTMLFNIKCLTISITITKAKSILSNIILTFPYIKTNDSLLYIFLKLINSLFNPVDVVDRNTMTTILNIEDVVFALKNLTISLSLRSELLIYIKHNIIDAMYIKHKEEKYIKSIVTCEDDLGFIKFNKLISNFHYPTKLLSFNKEFVKQEFDEVGYEALVYEMTHLKDIIEVISDCDRNEDIRNYFENGIMLPLAAYLRKAFTIAHIYTGHQLLCITELIQLFLMIKLHIGSLKLDLWHNKSKSRIINNFDLKKTEEEYNMLLSKKVSAFDYTNLYRIINEQLWNMIDNIPRIDINKDFDINSSNSNSNNSSEALINLKALKVIENEYYSNNTGISESTKRMIRLYFIYKNGKSSLSDDHSCLFSCLNEICLEFESNFRSILITILISLPSINTSKCYFFLYKLLSIQTTQTQLDIQSIVSFMISAFICHLHHCLIILFIKTLNSNQSMLNIELSTAYNLIKILKFLCEEHNNHFQGHMLRPYEDKKNITLFNFLLHIIAKIILVSQWEETINETKKTMDYFYDLYEAIIELLIEVIQGNKMEALARIGKEDSFRKFVLFIKGIMFKDDACKEDLILKVRYQLMLLFISLLEEKNCSEEVKRFIINHLNINKMLTSIGCVLKEYYSDSIIDHNREKSQYQYQSLVKDYENLDDNIENSHTFITTTTTNTAKAITIINYALYAFFTYEYFHKNFSQTNQFLLTNILFHYIKLLAVYKQSDEAVELIKRINHISVKEAQKKFRGGYNYSPSSMQSNSIAPINLINEHIVNFDDDFIEKYYIVKFFEGITETIEVRTGNSQQTVIFTVLPQMIYLSEGTKIEFLQKVNRDSETTKKNDLIRHVEYFRKEISYYKKHSRIFAAIDFTYIQSFLYIYAGCINLFMLITLEGDQRLTAVDIGIGKSTEIITQSISLSIQSWGEYYNILVYIFVGLNGLMILLWIIFRMPLYYRLDKIAYMSTYKIKHKSHLNFLQKIRIAVVDSIYNRDYITTLIYMFIVSLIGAILNRGEIAYPFLLLTIINLNPTLKNIIVSVKMKYLELLLTYLLAFIIMYIYSNIGFFFFNEDFNAILDGFDDNFCHNLVFCFLSTLDYALRNRGGVGDLMIRISYERNKLRYLQRFFYDVTFFLLIVIIMIDLVFGILIGAFQELRAKEVRYENDKVSHCFLCHVARGVVEKSRQDFNEHRMKKHNVWSYVNYMMLLKWKNIQDLNAVDSYVKGCLEMRRICWLPTFGNNDNSMLI